MKSEITASLYRPALCAFEGASNSILFWYGYGPLLALLLILIQILVSDQVIHWSLTHHSCTQPYIVVDFNHHAAKADA